MLITLAVLRLFEPFARRSERLKNDIYVNALSCRIVITYPAVTKTCFRLKPMKKGKMTHCKRCS
jgi:hypothetical protein